MHNPFTELKEGGQQKAVEWVAWTYISIWTM